MIITLITTTKAVSHNVIIATSILCACYPSKVSLWELVELLLSVKFLGLFVCVHAFFFANAITLYIMYSAEYQGGPSVEVLSTHGVDLNNKAKVSVLLYLLCCTVNNITFQLTFMKVTKLFDRETRGFIYTCEGGKTARLSIPSDERRGCMYYWHCCHE